MKFNSRLDEKSHPPVLYLSGNVDESADFKHITLPKSGVLTMDLSEIRYLNSFGLRSWIQWILQLKHLTQIFLRQCPVHVVNQMNILHGFVPMSAVIESFYIPYYCKNCEFEELYLATRGRDYTEAQSGQPHKINIPQDLPCPKCGSKRELDVITEKYFKFLKDVG